MSEDMPQLCKNCLKPIVEHDEEFGQECLGHCALEIEELERMVQTLRQ